MASETNNSVIKVMVVEDHFVTRTGLKLVVEGDAQFKVVGEAGDGEEAVEQALALQPDVILMDVQMPRMDGIEAARQIKESHPQIAVIMLSSNEEEEAICASLAAGASGYCLKDVQRPRLYAAIRSVHAGDVWLDSTIAAKVLKYHNSQSAPSPGAVQANATSGASAQKTTGDFGPRTPALSARESEVIQLLVEGLSNQEIAERLVISLPTAKSHVRSILNKLAVDDRTQAAVQAMRRGLV